MIEVRLYSQENADEIPWPNTEDGAKLRHLILPLFKEGIESHIQNVKTRLFILACNQHLIPITVNEKEYENAYVASNYYALQFVEHWSQDSHGLLLKLNRFACSFVKKVMEWVKINQVVMVNNLLLTSTIFPDLTEEEIKAMVVFLQARFPHHLISMRHVDLFRNEKLSSRLKKNEFKLLKTRLILGFDPSEMEKLSSKVHYHHRRDLRLIEKEGYHIVRGNQFSPPDVKRALELYEKIYLAKHTSFSPRYTTAFLQNAIDKGVFEVLGIKKNDRLDAIVGCFVYNQTMITPFFGYETDIPFSVGLYRMMSTLILEESKRLKIHFNDSSGGERTKLYRGLKPYLEYTALCDGHLPVMRRLFWSVAQGVTNFFLFPKVKKNQLQSD